MAIQEKYLKMNLKQLDMKSKIEFRAVLSLIIVSCSFAFLFLMLFLKVPKENEALINVVSGAVLVGGVGAIVGYYFGSSKHQTDKETLYKIEQEKEEVKKEITE